MEIKAINYIRKEIVNEEDFFFSGELYIGPEDEPGVYEIYDFDMISIQRLYNVYQINEPLEIGFMLSRGMIILKYYNEKIVKREINSIVQKCNMKTIEETYNKLDRYFRRREN
jgi:hypothetical protein